MTESVTHETERRSVTGMADNLPSESDCIRTCPGVDGGQRTVIVHAAPPTEIEIPLEIVPGIVQGGDADDEGTRGLGRRQRRRTRSTASNGVESSSALSPLDEEAPTSPSSTVAVAFSSSSSSSNHSSNIESTSSSEDEEEEEEAEWEDALSAPVEDDDIRSAVAGCGNIVDVVELSSGLDDVSGSSCDVTVLCEDGSDAVEREIDVVDLSCRASTSSALSTSPGVDSISGGSRTRSRGGGQGAGLTARLGNLFNSAVMKAQRQLSKGSGEQTWNLCQVKGPVEDDLVEADIISCVDFNRDGELLATGDKGGRIVIFQRDFLGKSCPPRSAEYSVYCTFQSHEPEFDYLKSLEIEEKINKLIWLRRSNPAHFLLSTNDKTIKLWRLMERNKRVEGLNLVDDAGQQRDGSSLTGLRVPIHVTVDTVVEASPRRVFANAHSYHINSVSLNSDDETFLSADDLRINLWHLAITDQSFNIVDIKPANMEELTEVITAAEFHPTECGLLVYSSSKGILRLCDMRSRALCDQHAKIFEEPEEVTNRSFFSEIISSISDVRFSHSGQYLMMRDYLTLKVWDIRMESRPVESYAVHDYLRTKLCALYENDCIFDKFECVWSNNDRNLLTGSYNNYFRLFDRDSQRAVTFEASRDLLRSRQNMLKPRRVVAGGKRKKDEVPVDILDFTRKILHTAWHPADNIVAVAATNSLYIFNSKD